MTEPSLLRRGWRHAKGYAPSVMAAGLMYGGIYQIISALEYPFTNLALKLINAILRRTFRDLSPLTEYGAIPWLFEARAVAVGVIVMVLGMFIGLWVHARSQRQLIP